VKGKSQPVKIYGVAPASVRRHPRATLVATAQLAVIGDGRTCRARTADISEGGVALAGVPADWDVGSKLRIRLEGGGLSRPIVAEGTIVSRRAEGAGVQFTSVEDDSAPAVAQYVARERSASSDDQD
jgi:hypothetical protein